MRQDEKNDLDSGMASYAALHESSLGRRHEEPLATDRSEFQRDCSRIIHSSSFRKLQYKTQVFANQSGDLFRTRLTHSMEVAQLARSVARGLSLNADLAETLALAHDLGHAPFGHTGQHVLNDLMRDYGGFEHNLHGLRLVDELESQYLGFEGLNLLFETREGILKHCSAKNAATLGQVGERFLPAANGEEKTYKSPSLEAQLTDWCDAIAYTHADIEDGILMKFISIEQVEEGVPLFAEAMRLTKEKYGAPKKGAEGAFVKMATGIMLKQALGDLTSESKRKIDESGVKSLADVRAAEHLIGFSKDFADFHHFPLKRFLRENLYKHSELERVRMQQQEMLRFLFESYQKNPRLMDLQGPKSKLPLERQICDHIAGMTDREAVQIFQKLQVAPATRKSPASAARAPK